MRKSGMFSVSSIPRIMRHGININKSCIKKRIAERKRFFLVFYVGWPKPGEKSEGKGEIRGCLTIESNCGFFRMRRLIEIIQEEGQVENISPTFIRELSYREYRDMCSPIDS